MPHGPVLCRWRSCAAFWKRPAAPVGLPLRADGAERPALYHASIRSGSASVEHEDFLGVRAARVHVVLRKAEKSHRFQHLLSEASGRNLGGSRLRNFRD